MTKACQHLGISGIKYGQTSRNFMQDPTKAKQITVAESEATKDLGTGTQEITKEQATKAYQLKIKRDLEVFRKLQNAKYMTGDAQIKELSQVETSKTSDAMMGEFGFGLVDLLRAVEQQKLMEDEKIKGFVKMFEMQRKSELDARIAKSTPPAEMMKKILAEGKALGKAQMKADGCMTFEYFLQTSKIVTKYLYQMTKDGLEASVSKRRALLK